uniref:Uncharacterized protein n=1 Tax=Quercus lobata TaxID=97700 RepID=A0A7N2MUU7_QUELO
MSSPEMDEILFAYIDVAPHAVSLVLIRVDSSIQRLVYHVRKSLHEAKVRYLPLEKVILAVVHGRIAKWGTILGAFDIKYMPRTSVKGQVLVDLVAEFAEPLLEKVAAMQNMDEKLVGTISLQEPLLWKVYVDGAANQRGFGVGLVLDSPKQITIENLLHVPRSGNTHADSLATLATSLAHSLPRVILIEDLCKITEVRRKMVLAHQVRVGSSWMDPIVLFLRKDILLEDKSEADKVRRKASRF